ncbi:hypothetical protein BDB00DRAFT_799691 [Zychaea mexicana]|uniref:uncharacterized protein n=1 Tax=Zychaea mexicana TaxID=64656 RepID=UPI0022FED1FC|nr:uncharacterized protein BDB00DRAFT_799691 [Zychaea mexicana]KAI9498284.1 hypothetical protein BDB00DRAFT_799691 [Zychaea mexicana]
MSKLFRPSLAFILISLTCLQGFGLYFFLKGFLLTRQTLDIQATHNDVWEQFPLFPDDSNSSNDNNRRVADHPSTIPAKPSFDRVIVIVIDALRFDFLTPMPGKEQYYLNRLPIIDKLHRSSPSSSLLYQFRADPPTTTMQRVKGLMTGSLPTFIDAGANFASSAVNEDNLLRHVRQRFNSIFFMGDDTWVNLFPEVFDDRNRTFESDSFKMFDLHTVDNRILSHLWPIMTDQPDWQVAIAHFLGVDHCGHTYGPSHPNMASKLSQMNDVIERLVEYVDKDTLLVVMGDHGMSVEGDHGGESVEELMSGLFLYSERPLTLSDPYYQDLFRRIHRSRTEKLGYSIQDIVERLGYDATEHPIASQIHLVPTLAYLLGVPIPFGNLGAILPDVLIPDTQSVLPATKSQVLLHMAQQLRRNALQVHKYLETYWHHTQHPGFAPASLSPIYQHLWSAERMFTNIHGDNIDLIEQILFEYDAFLMSTIKYCDAIWAQFDVGSMVVGIVILAMTSCATLFVTFLHRPTISVQHTAIIWFTTLTVGLVGMLAFQSAQVHGWFEKMEIGDGLVAANCIALAVLFLIMSNRPSTTTNQHMAVSLDWISLVVGALIHAFTLASNSFVIWEDRGTRFIAATLCTPWLLRSLPSTATPVTAFKTTLSAPILVLVWIRLTGLTGQCREEQFPHCSYIHNGYLKFGDDSGAMLCYILVNAVLIAYILPRFFIQHVNRPTISGFLYCFSLLVVFVRQVADIYQNSPEGPEVQLSPAAITTLIKALDVYAPRAVYAFTSSTTIYALMTFKSNRKSCSWLLLTMWSVMLAMLQRPLGSTIILSVPPLIDLLTRHQHPSTIYTRLALLYVIGQHLFFVTAHQATFTSLPWKAAFIGFDDMNYYGGATLVALSTLSGHIVTWLSWLVLLSESPLTLVRRQLSIYLLLTLQSIPTFLSAIFVLILRRHLMTWKIFAPRFMLQGLLGMGASLAAITCERLLR